MYVTLTPGLRFAIERLAAKMCGTFNSAVETPDSLAELITLLTLFSRIMELDAGATLMLVPTEVTLLTAAGIELD